MEKNTLLPLGGIEKIPFTRYFLRRKTKNKQKEHLFSFCLFFYHFFTLIAMFEKLFQKKSSLVTPEGVTLDTGAPLQQTERSKNENESVKKPGWCTRMLRATSGIAKKVSGGIASMSEKAQFGEVAEGTKMGAWVQKARRTKLGQSFLGASAQESRKMEKMFEHLSTKGTKKDAGVTLASKGWQGISTGLSLSGVIQSVVRPVIATGKVVAETLQYNAATRSSLEELGEEKYGNKEAMLQRETHDELRAILDQKREESLNKYIEKKGMFVSAARKFIAEKLEVIPSKNIRSLVKSLKGTPDEVVANVQGRTEMRMHEAIGANYMYGLKKMEKFAMKNVQEKRGPEFLNKMMAGIAGVALRDAMECIDHEGNLNKEAQIVASTRNGIMLTLVGVGACVGVNLLGNVANMASMYAEDHGGWGNVAQSGVESVIGTGAEILTAGSTVHASSDIVPQQPTSPSQKGSSLLFRRGIQRSSTSFLERTSSAKEPVQVTEAKTEAKAVSSPKVVEPNVEPVEARPKMITKNIVHTVKAGDNLGKIARSNGVTVDDIIKWNDGITKQNKHLIHPGLKVAIHKEVAAPMDTTTMVAKADILKNGQLAEKLEKMPMTLPEYESKLKAKLIASVEKSSLVKGAITEEGKYKVGSGDVLSNIAKWYKDVGTLDTRRVGLTKVVGLIQQENNIANIHRLRYGQELKLPSFDQVAMLEKGNIGLAGHYEKRGAGVLLVSNTVSDSYPKKGETPAVKPEEIEVEVESSVVDPDPATEITAAAIQAANGVYSVQSGDAMEKIARQVIENIDDYQGLHEHVLAHAIFDYNKTLDNLSGETYHEIGVNEQIVFDHSEIIKHYNAVLPRHHIDGNGDVTHDVESHSDSQSEITDYSHISQDETINSNSFANGKHLSGDQLVAVFGASPDEFAAGITLSKEANEYFEVERNGQVGLYLKNPIPPSMERIPISLKLSLNSDNSDTGISEVSKTERTLVIMNNDYQADLDGHAAENLEDESSISAVGQAAKNGLTNQYRNVPISPDRGVATIDVSDISVDYGQWSDATNVKNFLADLKTESLKEPVKEAFDIKKSSTWFNWLDLGEQKISAKDLRQGEVEVEDITRQRRLRDAHYQLTKLGELNPERQKMLITLAEKIGNGNIMKGVHTLMLYKGGNLLAKNDGIAFAERYTSLLHGRALEERNSLGTFLIGGRDRFPLSYGMEIDGVRKILGQVFDGDLLVKDSAVQTVAEQVFSGQVINPEQSLPSEFSQLKANPKNFQDYAHNGVVHTRTAIDKAVETAKEWKAKTEFGKHIYGKDYKFGWNHHIDTGINYVISYGGHTFAAPNAQVLQNLVSQGIFVPAQGGGYTPDETAVQSSLKQDPVYQSLVQMAGNDPRNLAGPQFVNEYNALRDTHALAMINQALEARGNAKHSNFGSPEGARIQAHIGLTPGISGVYEFLVTEGQQNYLQTDRNNLIHKISQKITASSNSSEMVASGKLTDALAKLGYNRQVTSYDPWAPIDHDEKVTSSVQNKNDEEVQLWYGEKVENTDEVKDALVVKVRIDHGTDLERRHIIGTEQVTSRYETRIMVLPAPDGHGVKALDLTDGNPIRATRRGVSVYEKIVGGVGLKWEAANYLHKAGIGDDDKKSGSPPPQQSSQRAPASVSTPQSTAAPVGGGGPINTNIFTGGGVSGNAGGSVSAGTPII